MTERVEAKCENGHVVETDLFMDFDDMDVAERMMITGRCPQCGGQLWIEAGHYETFAKVLKWSHPLQVN